MMINNTVNSFLLQDLMITREAPLAERVLSVMEALLHGNKEYTTNLCASLRPVLLQALQIISVESMGSGLEHDLTAPGMLHNHHKIFRDLCLQKDLKR